MVLGALGLALVPVVIVLWSKRGCRSGALHFAAHKGRADQVRRLLGWRHILCQHDVNESRRIGYRNLLGVTDREYKGTPLELALQGLKDGDSSGPASRARVDTVRRLLASGADPPRDHFVLTEVRDDQAFHDVAQALMAHGVQTDAAMRHFIAEAQTDRVAVLLDIGAELPPCCVGDARNRETAEMLLGRGATPRAIGPDGETPLHRATDPDVVALLIAHGADPCARTSDGETPLHRATDLSVADALVRNGADINARDDQGRTVLCLVLDRAAAGERIWDVRPACIRADGLLAMGAAPGACRCGHHHPDQLRDAAQRHSEYARSLPSVQDLEREQERRIAAARRMEQDGDAHRMAQERVVWGGDGYVEADRELRRLASQMDASEA